MPTKSKRLPTIHLDSCMQISAYTESLKKEHIKELDLSDVSFSSMSAEKLSALGKMICDAEIESLILINNGIGKLSINCLTDFCQGLQHSKLTKWRIDLNQLSFSSFSEEHWKLLAATTRSLPLECLSLQHNDLANLKEAQFTQFKTLIKQSTHQCLIGYNKWNMELWTQIINAENEHETSLGIEANETTSSTSPIP
ncbi:leucine-rich repeat domain-containing protein [Legionella drancourtii]|nr:hypothetical protein [Legionella drancourtii]